MPACTPNSRASYDAQVTTLRASVRIAATADNDWQPDQFGMPAQLDRGQKLVKVDVQDPAWLHRPQSLRARLSHASPSACRD